LLGDTNAVRDNRRSGPAEIDEVIEGGHSEVLHYVQFNADELMRTMRKSVERGGIKLTLDESRVLLKFMRMNKGVYVSRIRNCRRSLALPISLDRAGPVGESATGIFVLQSARLGRFRQQAGKDVLPVRPRTMTVAWRSAATLRWRAMSSLNISSWTVIPLS
jgi:hypothetical protein